MSKPETLGSFWSIPRTGVIFVSEEATHRGYRLGHPEWANLGQGQPETGDLPGAPPRIRQLQFEPSDHDYAPVAGLWELREAVAHFYNAVYRKGMASQYTAENVAIAGGGRVSLTRTLSAVGPVNFGHFLPDYTAYEELLTMFRAFTPIPILLDATKGYEFTPGDLRKEILGRGLGALLISNPCNPTGHVLRGDMLEGWVNTCRDLECALLLDEFYSSYIFSGNGGPPAISAAQFVADVNRDPIVLINGLTKVWRYPGWRVSWVVGPKELIEAVGSAGSFFDGGGNHPLQRAAIPLMDPEYFRKETLATQKVFSRKRELVLDFVRKTGIETDGNPQGTFYIWGNCANLGKGLSNGMEFFRRALEEKVIVLPGEFFDVNPGKRRPGRISRFRSYIRLSFGAQEEELKRGLSRLEKLIS